MFSVASDIFASLSLLFRAACPSNILKRQQIKNIFPRADGTMTIEQSFTIMVAGTNDAPVFTSTTITNSTEDVEYIYTAKAS